MTEVLSIKTKHSLNSFPRFTIPIATGTSFAKSGDFAIKILILF